MPHVYYHTKFGRSSSNRLGVGTGSQKFGGRWGPTPLEKGRGSPSKTRSCPTSLTELIFVAVDQTI